MSASPLDDAGKVRFVRTEERLVFAPSRIGSIALRSMPCAVAAFSSAVGMLAATSSAVSELSQNRTSVTSAVSSGSDE